MHAVLLDFEFSRSIVKEMTGMLWVSCYVVEVSTLVVGGARHATPDDSRCVRHLRRYRRVTWRFVQGADRRAVSSLQLHRMMVADDHRRRRQQTHCCAQRTEHGCHLPPDVYHTLFPAVLEVTRISLFLSSQATMVTTNTAAAVLHALGAHLG